MRRLDISPRPGWRETVESQGFAFHSLDGVPYWNEAACYLFTAEEVDAVERAANELHELCLEACQHVIDTRRYREFGIPEFATGLIEASWEQEPPSLYGRFDLAFDGTGPPKMLEYNADTPTSLLEASVIQWFWLRDVYPKLDQFNSLHEKLVDRWAELAPRLGGERVHFTSTRDVEDILTVAYLRDTAQAAGLDTDFLHVDEIGWDSRAGQFVDLKGRPVRSLFKLYPWEWLVREEYAAHLAATAGDTAWIEPAWKMLLSNKAILPVLWELFPDHPNLLPAYADGPRHLRSWVEKPRLAREGANLAVVRDGVLAERTDGPYGDGERIWQGLAELPEFGGARPVVGAWVVGGWAAGMGIREAPGLVTTNLSRFVPHAFEG